jgi:hypothetical protein
MKMKVWLFTFTQPDRKYLSMRVAALDKTEACAIVSGILQRPLIAQENTHPEQGTILSAFGQIETQQSGVIRAIAADGTQLEPA